MYNIISGKQPMAILWKLNSMQCHRTCKIKWWHDSLLCMFLLVMSISKACSNIYEPLLISCIPLSCFSLVCMMSISVLKLNQAQHTQSHVLPINQQALQIQSQALPINQQAMCMQSTDTAYGHIYCLLINRHCIYSYIHCLLINKQRTYNQQALYNNNCLLIA
jgi:hypothetical protein